MIIMAGYDEGYELKQKINQGIGGEEHPMRHFVESAISAVCSSETTLSLSSAFFSLSRAISSLSQKLKCDHVCHEFAKDGI